MCVCVCFCFFFLFGGAAAGILNEDEINGGEIDEKEDFMIFIATFSVSFSYEFDFEF